MTVQLLCIPFAGAGASVFRPWLRHPFRHVRIVPLQLPGREERFAQSPCTTMAELVTACIEQTLAAAAPVALFGHSFGALVAYETAVRQCHTGPPPVRLLVSGAASPWLRRARLGLGELTDDTLVDRLEEMIGYKHSALRDPELRDLLLPALRADLTISDEYEPSSREPLPIPVSVLRGRGDSLVSREAAADWADVTTRGCERREFPGEHMYFLEDADPVCAAVDALFERDARETDKG